MKTLTTISNSKPPYFCPPYTDCEVCYEDDDDRICSSLGKLDRKKLFTKCGIKEVSTGYEVFFLT